MLHGVNQHGLDYYLFWSDDENDSRGIFSKDVGPFAYIATPGAPSLFVPDRIGVQTFTPAMMRDLIVILNTFTVSKPL
jgi:hypothetical protein